MLDEIISEPIDTYYEYFKGEFENLTGIKLNFYKEKQMKRRINTYLERKGINGYNDFLLFLKSDEKQLEMFIDYITINVTSFFRENNHWKVFEEVSLKPLLSKGRKIKIWSSACSTGEEAYSLAMSILSMNKNADFEIIASDIDETVLNKARFGIYNTMFIEGVSDYYLNEYFDRIGETYIIRDEVKRHITFEKLDLFNDEYPNDCDIIVCRNVLIYFTEDGKEIIYNNFYNSLNENGCLFTGNVEQIVYYKAYGFRKYNNFIYYKENK